MRLIMPEVIREGTALGDEGGRLPRNLRSEIEPMPGLVALLDKLRDAGIRCAVGSSGCRANVDFVREVRHQSFFDAKINGDMVTLQTRSGIYLTAAAALGLAPAECVVFEDAKAGIESARRAGAGRIVALASTHSRQMLAAETDADVIMATSATSPTSNIAEISARPAKAAAIPTTIGQDFVRRPFGGSCPAAPSQKPTENAASCPSRPFATSSALPLSSRIRDSAGDAKYFPDGYHTEKIDTFARF
ncbi:MAG: HAD family hydrolase [Alistipes finegoldii]